MSEMRQKRKFEAVRRPRSGIPSRRGAGL